MSKPNYRIAENNKINEFFSKIRVLDNSGKFSDSRFIVQETENGKIILYKRIKDAEMPMYDEIIEQFKKPLPDSEGQEPILHPPCRIGDIVYRINKGAKNPVIEMTVTELRLRLRNGTTELEIIASDDDGGTCSYSVSDMGKKLFLTKPEASNTYLRGENR